MAAPRCWDGKKKLAAGGIYFWLTIRVIYVNRRSGSKLATRNCLLTCIDQLSGHTNRCGVTQTGSVLFNIHADKLCALFAYGFSLRSEHDATTTFSNYSSYREIFGAKNNETALDYLQDIQYPIRSTRILRSKRIIAIGAVH